MRIESSVTSVSWIPSDSVSGLYKAGFAVGASHPDDPPPDVIGDVADLDELFASGGFRFANRLTAWIEVADGRVVDAGYSGRGYISSTRFGWGPQREVTFQPTPFPEIRTEPEITATRARFSQTSGGRTGAPMPRPVTGRPYVQWLAPTVWTTLALTIYADGSTGYELVGASSFPRHWIYDAHGKLAGKSALIDFKTWYHTGTLAHSPWRGHENEILATEAETALERRLSLTIMRAGGRPPHVANVRAGDTIFAEGEAADHIVLVLDGMVEVEAAGSVLAKLGPGSVLGERASLEQGRRTATVRALTDCRLVSYLAADLPASDLSELAAGHHREDQQP